IGALLDDRRYESCELGSAPASLAGQFGVYKVEAVERMAGVFNAAVHMNTAIPAGITLDRCGRIDNRQLVAIGGNADTVPAHGGVWSNGCTCGFPAFASAANMVMSRLRGTCTFDRIAGTFTCERATLEIRGSFPDSAIDGRVNFHMCVLWCCRLAVTTKN